MTLCEAIVMINEYTTNEEARKVRIRKYIEISKKFHDELKQICPEGSPFTRKAVEHLNQIGFHVSNIVT